MVAYRLAEPREPPQPQEVPKPSPGSGQLLANVDGYGLCHTDVGQFRRADAP
jgi:D-arabinose 1-dehydrogenase-like Zn-dependent alcohol dehydrogenase